MYVDKFAVFGVLAFFIYVFIDFVLGTWEDHDDGDGWFRRTEYQAGLMPGVWIESWYLGRDEVSMVLHLL